MNEYEYFSPELDTTVILFGYNLADALKRKNMTEIPTNWIEICVTYVD